MAQVRAAKGVVSVRVQVGAHLGDFVGSSARLVNPVGIDTHGLKVAHHRALNAIKADPRLRNGEPAVLVDLPKFTEDSERIAPWPTLPAHIRLRLFDDCEDGWFGDEPELLAAGGWPIPFGQDDGPTNPNPGVATRERLGRWFLAADAQQPGDVVQSRRQVVDHIADEQADFLRRRRLENMPRNNDRRLEDWPSHREGSANDALKTLRVSISSEGVGVQREVGADQLIELVEVYIRPTDPRVAIAERLYRASLAHDMSMRHRSRMSRRAQL
jgi:hypothetical protein